VKTAIEYIPKVELRRFAKRSDLWGTWLVLHAWGVIALSITTFILFPNPWVFAAAFLIIGSRQHGLSILAHDTAHGVLFENRALNEWIGTYRHYHLKHHRYAQSENDPDLPLSAKFPTTKKSLTRKFLRDVSGLTFLRVQYAKLQMKRRIQRYHFWRLHPDRTSLAISNALAPAALDVVLGLFAPPQYCRARHDDD